MLPIYVSKPLRVKSEVGLVVWDARVHQVCPHDSTRRGCAGAPVDGPMKDAARRVCRTTERMKSTPEIGWLLCIRVGRRPGHLYSAHASQVTRHKETTQHYDFEPHRVRELEDVEYDRER